MRKTEHNGLVDVGRMLVQTQPSCRWKEKNVVPHLNGNRNSKFLKYRKNT